MKEIKKRYWVGIAYPEDMPENWKEILIQTHLEIAISPLHDKDINEGTNEYKKPHYHIMLLFNNTTTRANVINIFDKINCNHIQYVESVKGMYNYLIHKNNPEKYQYDENQIIKLNGFDVKNWFEISCTEKVQYKKMIIELIKLNNITEYSLLLDYLIENDLTECFEIASNNTLLFNTYITSKRNKQK